MNTQQNNMNPPIIQKLIDIFSKFPTIGPRTAGRFVFYMIKLDQEEFNQFIETLKDLKNILKTVLFALILLKKPKKKNFVQFAAIIPEIKICFVL